MSKARSSVVCALWRSLFAGLILAAMIVFRAGLAYAVAGDLDPTFGVVGQLSPVIPSYDGVAVRALACQDDGRIVGLGVYRESQGSDLDFVVFRLLPNGDLDTSFGAVGWVITDFGSSWNGAYDMVIQADGKILVVGGGDSLPMRGVMARYNIDGTLDANFGPDHNGKVVMPSSFSSLWRAVALQADGKIIVAGYRDGKLTVARFTTLGSLDTTFDSDGIASLPTANDSWAVDVAVDGDGRILVAGDVEASSTESDFLVAKYNSDGSIHTSFGGGGVYILDFGTDSDDQCAGMAMDGSGRIVVGGRSSYTDPGGEKYMATMFRLTSGGSLDTTFGTLGKVFRTADTSLFARGMLLDPVGRVVMVGGFSSAGGTIDSGLDTSDYESWLMRFSPDGAVDHGFGMNGFMSVAHQDKCSAYVGVYLDSQDRLLCAGAAWDEAEPWNQTGMIARHQTDDHTDYWGAAWWWSDPERNDNYSLEPSLVYVHANAQQNLWDCQRLQAPMFYRDLPRGDHWTVQTLVYVPSLNQDTLAGLMLWNGAESGAVHAAYVGLADVLGTRYVIAQGSIPEMCATWLPYVEYALDTVVVRIMLSEGIYHFYYAVPFGPWMYMGGLSTTAHFSKVGFMAKTWSTNDIEAWFSFFTLVKPGATSGLDLLLSP